MSVFASFVLCFSLCAQNSDCTYFENYDNIGDWTLLLQGQEVGCSGVPRGDILFQDGVMKWEVVRDGGYDTRYFKELGFTLCDSWNAAIDVTIQAGGSGSVGPFALEVLAFTSGSAQIIDYYVGSNILLANQDGVIVRLTSLGQSNWMFEVILRDGTTKATVATIPISNTYGVTYHIEIQQINTNFGYITITSDDFTPPFTASACFDIPSTITNLTHIQQGSAPIGGCVRRFTGELDNVCIKNCTSNAVELIGGTTDYSACSDTEITADLYEIIPGNTYQWTPPTGISNPNILNPTINVNESTEYMVIATGDCGIADTLLILVDISATDVLEIIGDSVIALCTNQVFSPELSTNLTGNTYSWTPAIGLSDPTVLNPGITITEPIVYTLSASNPCTADATFELSITVAEPLDFDLISEMTICKGDTIEIPGQLNSAANVTWSNSNSLSALDIPNPLAFPSSNTTYQVTVSSQCEEINQSFTVFVNDIPHLTGISNLSLCIGDTAYANIKNSGNFEVNNWNWEPNMGLTNHSVANPGIFNPHNTTYHITATNTCGTDNFELHLSTYDLDAQLNLDSIICPGTPILLSAQGAETYSWFPADIMNNPHDSITIANIYSNELIQLQLSGGTCVKTFSDFVRVYENIGFNQLDAVHLFPGEYYDLSPIESQYNIIFSGPSYVSFDRDTTISLSYTDLNGCEFYLNLPILIEPALYIPNGFTPDGDGTNDIFKAIGQNIKKFEMRIYNRWGELVFQSHSLNDGWNGGIGNYYCPGDIYNYVVEYSYHTTEAKVQRGFVTLIR